MECIITDGRWPLQRSIVLSPGWHSLVIVHFPVSFSPFPFMLCICYHFCCCIYCTLNGMKKKLKLKLKKWMSISIAIAVRLLTRNINEARNDRANRRALRRRLPVFVRTTNFLLTQILIYRPMHGRRLSRPWRLQWLHTEMAYRRSPVTVPTVPDPDIKQLVGQLVPGMH